MVVPRTINLCDIGMVILTLCPLLGNESHSVIVTGVWWCHTINLCDIGMVILTLCPLLGKKSHSVIVTGVCGGSTQ